MYGKIFERMFTGTMYGSGPVVFSVWAYVIACARPPGVVTLNPKLLAATIGCSTEEIRDAIEFLMRPDQESATKDEDGRRLVKIDNGLDYHVISWQKYRDMRDEEHRREYMRDYMRERRANNANTVNKANAELTEANEADGKQKLAKLAKAEAEAEAVKRRTAASPPPCPDDVQPSVWQDWVALRRSKKAPVSDTVVAAARSEAAKASMPFEAFLREWVLRGSQGLKAEWLAQSASGADPPMGGARRSTAYDEYLRELKGPNVI